MSRITLLYSPQTIESDLGYIESNAGDQNDIRYLEFHRQTFRKLSGPWLSSLIFVQNTILYCIALGLDTQFIENEIK